MSFDAEAMKRALNEGVPDDVISPLTPAAQKIIANAVEQMADALTDEQEQAIRTRYGYGSSERRTWAERQAVANRIRERLGLPQKAGSRMEAIELGRKLGLEAAEKYGEEGQDANQRIARAMAYAAWEYDGRPLDHGDRYRIEFGITGTQPYLSAERPAPKQK